MPTSPARTDENERNTCLAATSLVAKHLETRSSLPRFHVILLPHRLLSPSIPIVPCGFSSVAPLVASQDRQLPESEGRRAGRHVLGRLRSSNAPHSPRGTNWSQAWPSPARSFRTLTKVSRFLLLIPQRAAKRIITGLASQEYPCSDRRFSRFRRSAKAFPFGLSSTRFWPTRSTPLVAISLT